MKWHPDKNPHTDTTQKMQNIIEAYIFLKDSEARERYDKIYYQFKQNQKIKNTKQSTSKENQKEERTKNNFEFEFNFSDEILKKWMQNAKNQAQSMRNEVIDEFKGATLEAGKSIGHYLLYLFVPMIIGFLLFKACNN